MTAIADQIPPDTRPIDEMPFGSGSPDPKLTAALVREMLHKCGVTVAHEIEELGCTGASAKGLAMTEIVELRMGLAGGGVGLTCFVPPTRYCLAHSTIGGLQVGQASRFPEEVVKVSRELSPRERGHVEVVEASRRVRGGDMSERLMKTADALSGRDLPLGVELEDGEEELEEEESTHSSTKMSLRETGVPFDPLVWACPEHRVPVWACRYCIAQMIVEGPLEPKFVVREAGQLAVAVDDVSATLDELTTKGVAGADLYARVATFSRKLARD